MTTPTGPGPLPRRTVLKGVAAAGLAAGGFAHGSGSAGAVGVPVDDWGAFDRSVGAAFARLKLVGAAVAVVSRDAVLHTLTLGNRQLNPRRPVTADTAFVLASVTKPLTATMVADYVDAGVLAWDQLVVDAWSGFRAPTEELTRTLKVRDLMNMWSGIGRDPAMDFHVTDMSAADLVRGLVSYPVIAPPHQAFFYNNDVYALGGYLPLLASGTALKDLGPAYAQAMHDRVFRPAGMTAARMSTDPRMVYDDYAAPYGFDLRTTATAMPFASNGGAAPAGQAVGTIKDMAAWVRLQLRQGVSVSGERVASAASLAECWTPEWSQTVPPGTGGDVTATGYGLGFSRTDYRDGTQVVWHNGALDGFTTYAGFMPQHDLGLVVLTNMNLYPSGAGLWTSTLNLLLNQRFGLSPGAADQALIASDSELATLAALGRQTVTVDLKKVEPFLGYYEKGWSLVRDRGTLQLLIGPRRLPLAAMPDGSYVVTEGLLPGARVDLAVESSGVRHVEIVDFETVRQVNGVA